MTPQRKEKLTHVLQQRQCNLTVVLENVNDPHNISAVMRTCEAVGIQDVYILNTQIPEHKKWGSKSSSSALKWLTIYQYTDVSKCFLELRKNYQYIYTTHLDSNAVNLYDIDLTESVALIFGNEHEGVSEELIHLADGNFIIPQVGVIQSLNISVACAVAIYEAYRQKKIAHHYDAPSLSKERINKLMIEWGER